MEDMMMLLADNMLLIIGLVCGLCFIGLRKLAEKTENKIDDVIVDKIVDNKKTIIQKIVDFINSKIKK